MLNEEESKDWDPEKEESPPESLKRKWIEREYFGKETLRCPGCGKFIPAESLSCLFCDSPILHDTGLLGKILRWIKRCF